MNILGVQALLTLFNLFSFDTGNFTPYLSNSHQQHYMIGPLSLQEAACITSEIILHELNKNC